MNNFQSNFQSINHVDSILNQQHNGRVNKMSVQPPCKSEQFKMFVKINIGNQSVDHRRAVCGVQQLNEISGKYFSEKNMKIHLDIYQIVIW